MKASPSVNSPLFAEISAYLNEDIGSGDITANIIPETVLAEATVMTRETMVVCGQLWFNAVFSQLNPEITIDWLVREGDVINSGITLCNLNGPARALLTGERTALNLLQTLSATATAARQYADAIAGTQCKILDTRKTIPGL